MVVIHKQQHWDGDIVDDCDLEEKHGRPSEQRHVWWKSLWLYSGCLTAPGLAEN